MSRNGHDAVKIEGNIQSMPKTRSKLTIRRFGVVATKKYKDHEALQETGLHENGPFANLGKDSKQYI